MTTDVKDLIRSRGVKHGAFETNAQYTQSLYGVVEDSINYPLLTDVQSCALYMICHKIGRILAGDPREKDHWLDIAGYATLVIEDMERYPPDAPYE